MNRAVQLRQDMHRRGARSYCSRKHGGQWQHFKLEPDGKGIPMGPCASIAGHEPPADIPCCCGKKHQPQS